MRGDYQESGDLFSYVSLEKRVPANHPIRKMRRIIDEALEHLDATFDEIYADKGRPSIPPALPILKPRRPGLRSSYAGTTMSIATVRSATSRRSTGMRVMTARSSRKGTRSTSRLANSVQSAGPGERATGRPSAQ